MACKTTFDVFDWSFMHDVVQNDIMAVKLNT